MRLLAVDVGSSSVKAAVLRDDRIVGRAGRASFPTRYSGVRAEVDAGDILRAVGDALAQLGRASRGVDLLAMTAMSPAWVALDRRGRALAPVVTHQDRRSVEEARRIERRVGAARHLRLAGNRPFPGGISSTTTAWHARHRPGVLRRAATIGHVNTLLLMALCGARVTDPSNAAFTGLYRTCAQGGWSAELCTAAGARLEQLPRVVEADVICGRTRGGAFGLTDGLPVLTGFMDGSAGMMLAGADPGRLVNVAGSTDVLALCTDRARPHPRLLTRPLGVGRRWLSVSTLAAAGSALAWARQALFADLSEAAFHARLAAAGDAGGVTFDPWLAGDRTSVEPRAAAFHGMTLGTTREHLLASIAEALARSSAERLSLIVAHNAVRPRREVVVTGGVGSALQHLLHRDWPGRWTFRNEEEATLRGLGRLARGARQA